MTRRFSVRLFAFLLFFAMPALVQSQEVAAITGVVTDSSGAVLQNVTVSLVNTKTNVHYDAVTNKEGSYRIVGIAPGPNYSESFTTTGFSTFSISDLYLAVATTRTQDAVLQIGSTTDKVEVSGGNQTVTINTTDATIGNNLDVKLVNDLPVQNRQSPQVLFSLQPGITNGAVTGARYDQSTTTIDGLDVNDIAAGQGGTVPSNFSTVGGAPVDAIQEFRGTVAGQIANGGTGGGGQFQLVTKSGSNAFHGNINEYHRDTITTANDWFLNNAGIGRPARIQNQFGGNIGGPIKRDKLFFFFNYLDSRIIQSANVSRTVPLDSFRNGTVSYIKATANGQPCAIGSRQNTTPQCIGTLTGAQVALADPKGVGFNQGLLAFINQRYPHVNDLTGGDGVNTGLFRFTTPTPNFVKNYDARIDYNLTSTQKVFGRFTINRQDSIQSAPQFAGDPVTSPFQDRSYAYVVGHIWAIGSNKVNQFSYGDTIQKYNFANTFNPSGTSIYTFGPNPGGNPLLVAPYASQSSQKRRIPIPMIRDDFNWTVGSHQLQFGGTFKFIKTNSQLVGDFNSVSVGLGGNVQGLNAGLRPLDIRGGSTAALAYDNAFTLALGRVGSIGSNYNYDNKGNTLPQGGGATRAYRYFQTEVYFGDIWKISPNLTVNYGVRYQLYSVPFETHGLESVQNFGFDDYFTARQKQSAAGISGDSSLPFLTYALGGKANNGPSLYQPNYKDVAPRVAFAYSPGFDRKTTFNGSAGIIFDRTVINAVNFVQDQSSYLFQNTATQVYGSNNARTSLLNDPRLGANNTFPTPPVAPAISAPYTPYVDGGVPGGLGTGQANTAIDPHLKDPYSIAYNFGLQHEFPAGFIMKMNYVGRLGRRLLAQADASQLLDFPDAGSGQTLGTAFGNITTQGRANGKVTPQPWFENNVGPGGTQFIYTNFASLVNNGDFADVVQALAANNLIPSNVGLASQFAINTYITNKGSSNYNGMLFTLTKNLSQGLRFDFNYTLSHSIDNTSQVANSIASNSGYGFICDARNLRVCRANSDFDITHVMNSDVVYDLPFGRGRTFASGALLWLEEAIGGWQISAIPQWRSGQAFTTATSAFVAGYANNAPAIFSGDRVAVEAHAKKQANGTVNLFSNPIAAQGAFTGPVGFNIGSRNNLRGPSGFFMDAGLGKRFAIIPEKLNLNFRADAFNVLNHPVFAIPNTTATGTNDITSGQFGQIIATTSTARIGQFSLRLEF